MAKELAPVEIFNERQQMLAQTSVVQERNRRVSEEMGYDPRFYDIKDYFDLRVAILETFDGKKLEDPERWLAKEAEELAVNHALTPQEIHTKLADIYILINLIADRDHTNLFKEVVERLKIIK